MSRTSADFLDQDVTPLGARAALAMSRVLVPLDPARSLELREHALDLAFLVGKRAADPKHVPALLDDDPDLRSVYLSACLFTHEFPADLVSFPVLSLAHTRNH